LIRKPLKKTFPDFVPEEGHKNAISSVHSGVRSWLFFSVVPSLIAATAVTAPPGFKLCFNKNLSQNQSRSARGMEFLIVLRGFVRGTKNFSQNLPRSARGEEIFINEAVLFAALKGVLPTQYHCD